MEASEQIDQLIAAHDDWRGLLLTQLRKLVHAADPEIAEEWKWGTAVFAHRGNVCALAPFKDHVKLNFFQGARLADPHGLFNAGLEAKATRAIDFEQGATVNEPALKALIRSAVTRTPPGAGLERRRRFRARMQRQAWSDYRRTPGHFGRGP